MSQMPEDWSVEVEAGEVVVRSGPWSCNAYLSPGEARALANELGIAYLAVTGVLGVSDPDALRSALKDYTERSVPALDVDAHAQSIYDALREWALDAGCARLARESSSEPDREEGDQGGSPTPDYEIRDYRREPDGLAQIEAWLPGWLWPAVRAVQRDDGWLVLVGPEVSATAGVHEADRSGLDAVNADEARIWVKLLAALYVKASGK